MTELEDDNGKHVFDGHRLGLKAQKLLVGDDEEWSKRRMTELNLMETVEDISFVQEPADLAILYEITGFQADNVSDYQFWANYESYKLSA